MSLSPAPALAVAPAFYYSALAATGIPYARVFAPALALASVLALAPTVL